MMYALIVILGSQGDPYNIAKMRSIFQDLDTCLTQKEELVKAGQDAHCFRLEEPPSTVKDLEPNNTTK